jgi:transposase-like protein
MQKEVKEALRIRFKLAVLDYAQGIESVTKACRLFEVPRSSFYEWRKTFDNEGKAGLARKKPIARSFETE